MGFKHNSIKVAQRFSQECAIDALFEQPETNARGANKLRLLVNGRSVRDKTILSAVRQGFGNYIKGGNYPIGVLDLELPPGSVDVNVHPQKSELRFREPQRVYSLIVNSIASSLAQQHSADETAKKIPDDFFSRPNRFDSNREGNVVRPLSFSGDSSGSSFYGAGNALEKPAVEARSPEVVEPRLLHSDLRIVGLVFECFIVVEQQHQMLLIDMHAAHERIKHVEFCEQLIESGNVTAQRLLLPIVRTAESEVVDAIDAGANTLKRFGLEIERLEPTKYHVTSYPAILTGVSLEKLLTSLEEFSADFDWTYDWSKIAHDHLDDVVSRFACHASVRRGDAMSHAQLRALVEKLFETESSRYCPHGRSIIKVFAKGEVEGFFGR